MKATALLVLGPSRSGSTILGKVLGELPGFHNVGESIRLWSRLQAGASCGCGEPLGACGYWAPVLAELGPEHSLRPTPAPSVAELAAASAALYAALDRVHAPAVIVDTSKDPRFGRAAAAGIDGLDGEVLLLGLTRDPRGLLLSRHRGWRKDRDVSRRVPIRDVVRTALSWQRATVSTSLALRGRGGGALLRYEDFTADPVGVLAPVLAGLASEASLRAVFGGEGVHLSRQHALGGNPVKYAVGQTRISEDQAWRSDLSTVVRTATYVLSSPVAPVAGYRLGGR